MPDQGRWHRRTVQWVNDANESITMSMGQHTGTHLTLLVIEIEGGRTWSGYIPGSAIAEVKAMIAQLAEPAGSEGTDDTIER